MASWWEADEYGPRDDSGRWVGYGGARASDTLRRVLGAPEQASDDEVMDAFGRLSRVKKLTADRVALLDVLGAELDRRDERERAARAEAEDPPEVREARLRADELIAAGVPWSEAFQEAFAAVAGDEGALTDVDRRQGETREQTRRRLYQEQTYLVMLQAEAHCRGHLLTAACRERGVSPAALFSGPANRARKCASEDLLRFWTEVEPRRTYQEWRSERLTGSQGARQRREKVSGREWL